MARLRSQGPVMTAIDSLSKASGRKKRARSPTASPRRDSGIGSDFSSDDLKASAPLKTPSKSRKKVRFSDPGPEVLSYGQTGLTPSVARASLDPAIQRRVPGTPRLLSQAPRRRYSMPNVTTLASLGSAENPIEVCQFMPLRQALTPRTRRQLKRNHLSEELNNIEAEGKSISKLQHEVQRLKDELSLAKQRGADAAPLDKHRNADRIRELEEEIVHLKYERSISTEPDLSLIGDTAFIADSESVDLLPPESGYGTASPSIEFDEDTVMTVPSSPTPVRDMATNTFFKSSSTAVQTDVTSQSLTTLYSFAQAQNRQLNRARLSLEHLFPGETALSLSLSSDCGPLLDAMLSCLEKSQQQLSMCRASLVASQTQESNLRAKFNASLKQLDEARAAHAKLIAEKQQVSSTQVEAANDRIASLEAQIGDYEKSHARATAALDRYREDVHSLQALIQNLEIEHAGTVAKLQTEKDNAVRQVKEDVDDAVADLECMVAAETRGRKEAEKECDEIGVRAKESRIREKEAKAALNEKQKIVRELEGRIEGMEQAWEKEVGGLNARIGQLCAEVENKKDELTRSNEEMQRLVGVMQVEKQASRKSLDKIMAEINRCHGEASGIEADFTKSSEARSEQVVSALGLLTPSVEGGRFRDVTAESDTCEGRVEVSRGKARRRKVDSGIGILLEDGGED